MDVYGELGRYSLFVNRYTRIIKYWCKTIVSENVIIQTLYNDMVSGLEDRNNWCKNVKSLLDVYGFSYVWLNPNNVDLKTFHIIFKNRVLDVFKQSWFESVNTSSTLFMYKYVKEHLMLEPYLDLLPKQLRNAMSRLRLSSHKLRVETGRYGQNRIARAERYCTMCNNTDIEDEFHFYYCMSCV